MAPAATTRSESVHLSIIWSLTLIHHSKRPAWLFITVKKLFHYFPTLEGKRDQFHFESGMSFALLFVNQGVWTQEDAGETITSAGSVSASTHFHPLLLAEKTKTSHEAIFSISHWTVITSSHWRLCCWFQAQTQLFLFVSPLVCKISQKFEKI